MTNSTQSPTTVTDIAVAMFAIADQDAAIAFYTEKLGFEVRADSRFGPDNSYRWVEVAPPGSTARLALNPPMEGSPGGGAIGVETKDVQAEHKRIKGIDGLDVDEQIMQPGGDAPSMFAVRDPDGNQVWVVQAA